MQLALQVNTQSLLVPDEDALVLERLHQYARLKLS